VGLYFPFPALLFLGQKNCPTPSHVAHPSGHKCRRRGAKGIRPASSPRLKVNRANLVGTYPGKFENIRTNLKMIFLDHTIHLEIFCFEYSSRFFRFPSTFFRSPSTCFALLQPCLREIVLKSCCKIFSIQNCSGTIRPVTPFFWGRPPYSLTFYFFNLSF